ncbi:hypothetical protein B0I08_11266 [Glaciihabitans tibetensis]|uniref:Uncharacterized protein n=1 Tax=Glaciihabitans tibetensis TaxID=1266600 RepID=A0A2T0V3E7_9MICO|nr:hypothetical protein [Glaciihabitans tibetensis]PRY64681.1 hypothetical protein B0I08_11266 [Glaciihabitans tibetensis]
MDNLITNLLHALPHRDTSNDGTSADAEVTAGAESTRETVAAQRRSLAVSPVTRAAPYRPPTHATIAGDSPLTSVGEYRKRRGELDTVPIHQHR